MQTKITMFLLFEAIGIKTIRLDFGNGWHSVEWTFSMIQLEAKKFTIDSGPRGSSVPFEPLLVAPSFPKSIKHSSDFESSTQGNIHPRGDTPKSLQSKQQIIFDSKLFELISKLFSHFYCLVVWVDGLRNLAIATNTLITSYCDH